MEKLWCLYGETTVSLRRNCSVPPWILQCPALGITVSSLRHCSIQPWELQYLTLGTVVSKADTLVSAEETIFPIIRDDSSSGVADTSICNLSATGICNVPTIYQLVCYTRLVAGGRCFYVFQLYSRKNFHSFQYSS